MRSPAADVDGLGIFLGGLSDVRPCRDYEGGVNSIGSSISFSRT